METLDQFIYDFREVLSEDTFDEVTTSQDDEDELIRFEGRVSNLIVELSYALYEDDGAIHINIISPITLKGQYELNKVNEFPANGGYANPFAIFVSNPRYHEDDNTTGVDFIFGFQYTESMFEPKGAERIWDDTLSGTLVAAKEILSELLSNYAL